MSPGRPPRPRNGELVTEQPNPRTTDLDRLPLGEMLERIIAEDATVPEAVRAVLPALERAATLLFETLSAGGRWFNLGAGTSGRLGVLDAAELPPTFGITPDRVQAILAGGPAALERAVEGAEDDAGAAREELDRCRLEPRDTVVGISASGRTPFVRAGIEYARQRGAHTVGITCNPDSPLAHRVEVPVVLLVGPEVVAGSTRMKGGLAQKMVLHALSTAVMARLGRVRGNLMTEIRCANAKLRDRAVRVVARLGSISRAEATHVLEECGGSVGLALERLGIPLRGHARERKGGEG